MPLLLAKSSSGESYEVTFETIDELTTARCSCAAGDQQQLCKHLVALLMGDISMLFQQDQEPELLAALELVNAVGIIRAHSELQEQLAGLESELRQTKQRVEKARKALKASFMGKLREGYRA